MSDSLSILFDRNFKAKQIPNSRVFPTGGNGGESPPPLCIQMQGTN